MFFVAASIGIAASAQSKFSAAFDKDDVVTVCNAVAQWQVANHASSRHPKLDWTNGALYRGMVEWGKMTGDPTYFNFVRNIGEEYNWSMWKRTYHADDICVGQAFIEMYKLFREPEMMRPAMERAFWVANHPSKAPLVKTDPIGKDERWSWCDALFMAPPVYAALYNLTGEKVYVDYMENEFRECTDSLFDKDENLYYRDCKRIPLREPNGAKQLWGRGNGWVYGGIPLIIENLPDDYPVDYYLDIFQKMTKAVLKTQDENGAWHSSMLDHGSYPMPENSASAFFCYGLAWGINNGYLKGKKYEEALKKGWASLVSGVHENGFLGYIQPVGAAPRGDDRSGYNNSDVYGVGAFLLAGSEIYQMCGGEPAKLADIVK